MLEEKHEVCLESFEMSLELGATPIGALKNQIVSTIASACKFWREALVGFGEKLQCKVS